MSNMVDTVEKMTVLLAERDAEIARLKAMLERAYDKQAQKAIRNYTVNELGRGSDCPIGARRTEKHRKSSGEHDSARGGQDRGYGCVAWL